MRERARRRRAARLAVAVIIVLHPGEDTFTLPAPKPPDFCRIQIYLLTCEQPTLHEICTCGGAHLQHDARFGAITRLHGDDTTEEEMGLVRQSVD